jgi:hypothetical protein
MSKVVDAEYDASENVFRLVAPLEGVEDHEKVKLALLSSTTSNSSILAFRGCLSGENGEDFAARIDEMFPIER